MFILRGIAVSLAFFVSLYCVLSLAVACAWKGATFVRNASPRSYANLLFTLRVFPLVASAFIVLAFAVPSFLWLEPRSVDEDLGVVPVVLGIGCLLLFADGGFRVMTAQARTSRVISNWLRGANTVDVGASAPTFQSNTNIPPLTLAGVCKPKLLVSEFTMAVLDQDELHIAVKHEVAHMRSLDNLKKLLFRFSLFPGMAKLEHAWQEAAEIAADDAAVSSFREALDLAAALIKLSRLVPMQTAPVITMGLVQCTGSVSARVARLLAWEEPRVTRARTSWWYAAPALAGAILSAAATYSTALAQMHRVTEWLVR